MKDKSDICFLQESYSTPEVEKIWKSQWKGEMFFSHGTEHSKGVLILIKNSLEFELKTSKVDQNGRFIILEANVQDHPFLFVNLYAPNKTNEQSTFFEEIRFKMVDSPLCAFCNAEVESLEHLLYFCKSSSFFWKELLSWIAVEANIVLNASLLDILFGKFDHLETDFLLVNHILLLAKYFIYKCKLSKVIPSLSVFKAKLKATYKVELFIAKEKGILLNHYKKWDNFLSWLS